MPTAYKVKRHEPLSVSDITVTFDRDVRELSSNNVSSDDNNDDDTDDHYCVKTIHATITGRETVSGRQVTLGEHERRSSGSSEGYQDLWSLVSETIWRCWVVQTQRCVPAIT